MASMLTWKFALLVIHNYAKIVDRETDVKSRSPTEPKASSFSFFSKKWANPGLFFVYFRPYLITISIIQIKKSVDVVLEIRTRGGRMVGADETMERPH